MVGMDKNKEILDDTLEVLMLQMIKEKFVARLKNDKAFLWRISGCGEAYIYEIEKTVPRSGKSFKRD